MSAPIRAVFFGTADFAVPALRALAADEQVTLAAVFTQPDRPAGRGRRVRPSPVAAAARELGVRLEQPDRLRADAVAAVRSYEPEVVVLAAYGLIIPRAALAVPPLGWLNLHPSLLPRYRGASPVATPILDGETTTGLSIFLMGPGVDDGPILRQWDTAIGSEETTGELTARLAELAARRVGGTLREWAGRRIRPREQDHHLATYTRKLSPADAELDWDEPARVLHRRVRAYTPWPVARTTWQRGPLRVLRAAVSPYEPEGPSGSVHREPAAGMPVVRCGAGALRLTELQLPGGKPLDGRAFIAGHAGLIGSRLGG